MPSSDRSRRSVRLATSVPMLAVLVALLAALLVAATALAASPSPTGAAVGDPRSPGVGPGLVGDPLFAIGVVTLVALGSLLASLAYVRATGGRRSG